MGSKNETGIDLKITTENKRILKILRGITQQVKEMLWASVRWPNGRERTAAKSKPEYLKR